MALTNALTDAVTAPYVRHFAAVQIILANTGSTINLCDGSGFVTFDVSVTGNAVSTTFVANDPIYGTLSSVAPIPSAVLTSAPNTQIALLPPSSTGVAALNDPQNQLSQVYVWWGAVYESNGIVVPDPAMIWSGNLDFVKTTISGQSRTVQLEVITGLDKFWPTDEAMRVNDQSHQTIWPGETGLNQVIASSVDPTWGAAQAAPIYPQLTLAPTVGDQQAGITKAGKSTGATFGPSGQGGG